MLDYGLIANFHPWFKLETPAQSSGAVFVCVCFCLNYEVNVYYSSWGIPG